MCISPVEPTQQLGFWGWGHIYFLKPNLYFIGFVYIILFRCTYPTSISTVPLNALISPLLLKSCLHSGPGKAREHSIPAARAWVPGDPSGALVALLQHGERWARGGGMLQPRVCAVPHGTQYLPLWV